MTTEEILELDRLLQEYQDWAKLRFGDSVRISYIQDCDGGDTW